MTLRNKIPLDHLVAVVGPDATISDVVVKMASDQQAFFGLAVVVDDEKRLLGILNNGDVIRLMASGKDMAQPVSDVMITDSIAVSPGLSADEIIADVYRQARSRPRLARESVAHVLVTDAHNKLLDVIDFASLVARHSRLKGKVAIYGMGFVGLTLAVALASRGHQVTGVDVNEDLLANLRAGKVHVFEPGLDDLLLSCIDRGVIEFKSKIDEDDRHHISIVAVGTPVNDEGVANLNALEAVTRTIAENLGSGDLVLLRSTVPVGTTRNFVAPLLSEISGLQVGQDFHLSFSPERTVEGQAMRELNALPQIVGGLSASCAQKAATFWNTLTHTVVHVDGLEAAELVKLANNSFRDLSFAFSNALALMSDQFNVDAFKLISAANEGYPRNPIPLPSPGVGGYCLTKDPYLFAAVDPEKEHAVLARAGRSANKAAALYPIRQFKQWMERHHKKAQDCHVLILGMAFKGLPETNDLRGSTGLDVARQLQDMNVQVSCWDAVVSSRDIEAQNMQPAIIGDVIGKVDAVIIMNNHPDNIVPGMLSALPKPSFIFDGWFMMDSMQVEQTSGVTYATMGYMTPDA